MTAHRRLRAFVLVLMLGAFFVGQMRDAAFAINLPGGGASPALTACAAERAPILERQKQYDAIRRSRIGAALGEGIVKGATFFAGAMLNHYLQGSSSPSSGGGILNLSNTSAALQFQIPGVTSAPGAGAAFAGANLGASDTRAIAAMSVVVAIAGTLEAYVRLKQQQAGGDRIVMGNSIDDDARRQIEVNRAIAAEELALDACRQRQVDEYRQNFSRAGNDTNRRSLSRDKASLQYAIQKDVDLTGGVVNQQASLARTYTQGRAMSEGRSEADILAGQAPAYATQASTAPLHLPPTPPAGPGAAAPPPAAPPPAVYTTLRAVIVRAGPSARSARVTSLAKGSVVKLKDPTVEPSDWTAVNVDGGGGYILATDLQKTIQAAKGPTLGAPVNIREDNRAVLAARDQGPNRLKTLLTDVQARLRSAFRQG